MAAKIRLHELAKELGLTNKETLDLCVGLGIGVKSHSSSIEDAQADRARRKAERDGLKRDVQPEEEPKAPRKGSKAAKEKEAAEAAEVASPAVEVPAAAAKAAKSTKPTDSTSTGPTEPATIVPGPAVPAPTETSSPLVPAAEHADSAPSRIISSRPGGVSAPRPPMPGAAAPGPRPPMPGMTRPAPPPRRVEPAAATPPPVSAPTPGPSVAPAAAVIPAASATDTAASETVRPIVAETVSASPESAAPTSVPSGAPVSSVASETAAPPDIARRESPLAADSSGPSGAPASPGSPGSAESPGSTNEPRSATGRPIPPPPGPPRSFTGRLIPPPPGPRSTPAPGARPGGPGARPGGPGARPGGPGARPGGPGGPGGARPAGGPGAGAPGSRPGYAPSRPGGGSFPRTSVPGAGVPRGGPGAGGPGRGGPGGGRGGGGARPQQRQSRSKRRKAFEELEPGRVTRYEKSAAPVPDGEIIVERGASAQELGPRLNRTAADVVRFLMGQGELVSATMSLTDEMVELFAMDIGAQVLLVDPGQQQEVELQQLFEDDAEEDDETAYTTRPPVITVMGHVDHGKTTVLDRIRSANVVAGEAGGITQHIGAYQVEKSGQVITFIDTPGHEAFTQMRVRGAEVTDIVVLVVAANDGVMPQTLEALTAAKVAEVPIVVAINKIDIPGSDPNRVMQQLAEHGLVPEAWGGDTIMVEMSALQNLGIDDLLEQLLLVAEVEDLKAVPTGKARGSVLEANLDVGRGPVATILIEKGVLRVGDPIVAGAAWGTVRALINDKGEQLKEAGPSTPVQVLGLSLVPGAGDELRVAPNLKTAKTVGEAREQRQRFAGLAGSASAVHGSVKLEDLFEQIQKGEAATLNLILKADVQGSLEALTGSLKKLERPDVKITFVHRAVGGVTQYDVQLAATTGSTIIGFNVRPDRNSRQMAEEEKVQIRSYDIIYKVLEDMQSAMLGLLRPEYEEVVTGEAEVREVFNVPKIGAVAGCMVRNGTLTRGSKVRFLREGVVIWKGAIQSLRRFKDDVREVQAGFECGVGLTDFKDLKNGDIIETFDEREIARV